MWSYEPLGGGMCAGRCSTPPGAGARRGSPETAPDARATWSRWPASWRPAQALAAAWTSARAAEAADRAPDRAPSAARSGAWLACQSEGWAGEKGPGPKQCRLHCVPTGSRPAGESSSAAAWPSLDEAWRQRARNKSAELATNPY